MTIASGAGAASMVQFAVPISTARGDDPVLFLCSCIKRYFTLPSLRAACKSNLQIAFTGFLSLPFLDSSRYRC